MHTEALKWYAEQVEGCRKIGSFGDQFRQALDRDGGERARKSLAFDPIQMLVGAVTRDFDRRWLIASLRMLRNMVVSTTEQDWAHGKRDYPYDVAVGGHADTYMRRWWLLPRRKYPFNVYLHHFLRSDDDRALHDHPWWNVSILIEGSYIEHVPVDDADPAGSTKAIRRNEGDIVYRPSGTMSHRVELLQNPDVPLVALMPVWTLFITGPKEQEWGFHVPCKGDKSVWVPWQEFTGQDDSNGPVTNALVENDAKGKDWCGDD